MDAVNLFQKGGRSFSIARKFFSAFLAFALLLNQSIPLAQAEDPTTQNPNNNEQPEISVPGDVNNDGLVNLDDLNAIRNGFGNGEIGLDEWNSVRQDFGEQVLQPASEDSTPAPSEPNYAADVNHDGVINIEDLNVIRSQFGNGEIGLEEWNSLRQYFGEQVPQLTENTPAPNTQPVSTSFDADVNGDGVVNLDDLNAIRNGFGENGIGLDEWNSLLQNFGDYEYVEYSFEDALAQLSADYASAVIVSSLTDEDLQRLVELDIEVGVAVIRGKIVLFTTGNAEELRVNPAAAALLAEASLIAHTHPNGQANGPGLVDIENAGDRVEYVISANGIYAYSRNGIVQIDPYHYSYLVEQINYVHDTQATTTETRAVLNQFIAAIDEYNINPDEFEIYRSAPVTVFPGLPILSSFSTQPPAQPPANVVVTQQVDPTSTDPAVRLIHMTYNTSNGAFGGTIIMFGQNTPADLSGISTFIFDMKTDNNTNNSCAGNRRNCVKVEFEDTDGHRAAVFVSGLTSDFTQKSITQALLQSSNPDIDFTKIRQINFVIDHAMVSGKNNGFLDIRTGGLYFEPPIVPGAGPLTDLATNQPAINEIEPAGRNTITAFTQPDSGHASFTYNLANGQVNDFTKWGGALMSFNNPLNITSQDLVLQLKGTGTSKVKIELISGEGANEKKVTIVLNNLTANYQFYRISKAIVDQAAVPGFNPAAIKFMTIIIDDQLAGGNPNATGVIDLQTQGLLFVPAAQVTNDPVTQFANQPSVGSLEPCATAGQTPCVDGTLNTITQFIQDSHAHVRFDYNLGNGSDAGFRRFGGALINFGENPVSAAGPGIVLGLKGTGTSKVKLEFIDVNGKKVTVSADGLTNTTKNYKITQALLNSAGVTGFDATKIALIVIVVDDGVTGSPTASGTIELFTGGLLTQPTAVETDQSVSDFSAIHPTVGVIEPCATANQDPCVSGTLNTVINVQQPDNANYTFQYNLSNGSDDGFRRFAGTLISFGASTINATNGIVLGLKGTGTTGGAAKLEFIDVNGKKVTVKVPNLITVYKNYQITKALLDSAGVAGFDATKISMIVVVVDDNTTGSPTAIGTLSVNALGFQFDPIAIETLDPVTDFSATRPGVGELEPCSALGQDPCVDGTLNTITNLNQDSANHFSFAYDLRNGLDAGFRRFGGTIMNFGANTVDATSGLVFGLKKNGAGDLKIEFEDENGKKVTVRVNNLNFNSFKNYKITAALLNSAGVIGFDATKIKLIIFVIDSPGDPNANGTIEVNTAGLFVLPTAVETTNPVTDFSNQQPAIGQLEPCGVNQAPCPDSAGTLNTVTNVDQTSPDQFLFDFNLANGASGEDDFRRFAGILMSFGTNLFNATNGIVLGLSSLGGDQAGDADGDGDVDLNDFNAVRNNFGETGVTRAQGDLNGDGKVDLNDFNLVRNNFGESGGGTVTDQVKLVIEDEQNRRAEILVTNLTGTQKNYQITAALLLQANSQIDITKIKFISIVVDEGVTGNPMASGTIRVDTKGLQFIPVVDGTPLNTNEHTQLPNQPGVSASGGKVLDEVGGFPEFPGIGTITQTSTTDFKVDYDLLGGFTSFVFAQIGYGFFEEGCQTNCFRGTAGSLPESFTFGLKGPANGQIKVEIVDTQNRKAIFLLNTTGQFQNYTLSLAGINVPAGFDRNQIAFINYVIDRQGANGNFLGSFEVKTVGLSFIPVVDGTALNPAQHTVLPNSPVASASGGKVLDEVGGFPEFPGLATITQTSSTDFKVDYDLLGGFTSFVFAQIGYGFFEDGCQTDCFRGTAGSLPQNLTFGLKGPAGGQIKLEIVDATGQKGQMIVFNLNTTGEFQNYTVNLAGIDRTKIAFINFVIDREGANGNFLGSFEVKTAGLNFIPVIEGTALNPANHTQLQNSPVVSATGSKVLDEVGGFPEFPGIAALTQTSTMDFKVDYDLLGGFTSFVFAQIGHGFFEDGCQTDCFRGTAGSLPANFTFGLKGPAGAEIKVEIVDATGQKGHLAVFKLATTGQFQNYTIDLTGANVPAGFDRTKIAFINFVMDRDLAGSSENYLGSFEVKTAGLSFTPAVDGAELNPALHTPLPNSPTVSATGAKVDANDAPGEAGLVQTATTDFRVNYDVSPDDTSFVFSQISWGFFDDTVAEGGTCEADCFRGAPGSLPANFVFGLLGPANGQIKVEIVDATGLNGNIATFVLNTTGQFQNYTLNLTGVNVPPGFDITKIAFINFVVDRGLARVPANYDSFFEVKTIGLSYIPPVDGVPFDNAALTTLPNSPVVSSTGSMVLETDEAGLITINQSSTQEFEYEYQLPSPTSFVFAGIDYGFFDEEGNFNGVPADLGNSITLAAAGAEGTQIKVEIVDTNFRKAVFNLRLRPVYQNYTLSLEGANIPAAFNRQAIARIVFVSDRPLGNNAEQGVVQIQIKGLQYIPVEVGEELQTTKDNLISGGAKYFQDAIDPATHLPYDSIRANGVVETSAKFAQPTSIGFYLQMLGDAAEGKMDFNGMNRSQLFTEINTVLDSINDIQSRFGWNGLIPWVDLNGAVSGRTNVALGDNANLSQSIAVMIGALESIQNLSAAERNTVNGIIAKADGFLDRQEPGYRAFVDSFRGLFAASVNRNTGVFNGFIDRLMTEFRGAIAFLMVRYPDLPDTVWNNLFSTIGTISYRDRNGDTITDVRAFDGGAFQYFWPSLRNDESHNVQFRNILYNTLAIHLDFAHQHDLPGILSASQTPENRYDGKIGVPQIAETVDPLLINTPSTYALASAYAVAPELVLAWLNAIETQIPGIKTNYGHLDSVRSDSEIAPVILGIDTGATTIALVNNGTKAFNAYLRNRGMELEYNLIYERAADAIRIAIEKTTAELAPPPTFPQRTYAVFPNITGQTAINGFPIRETTARGTRMFYTALTGGKGGQKWTMAQNYNARSNKLVITASISDEPKEVILKLYNASNQVVHTVVVPMTQRGATQEFVIDLPDTDALTQVRHVSIEIDQTATGDNRGDFTINAIDFRQYPTI